MGYSFMASSQLILNQFRDQHSIKEFIIPAIMTYDHPHREKVWMDGTAKTGFRGENDVSR